MQQFACALRNVAWCLADQFEGGAAFGAGIGLGVESAVRGIGVLGLAGGAKREAGHRGGGAVVGDILNDGEPGTAVGAVGEGVLETAVGRVGAFGQAFGAGGDVGRDKGGCGESIAEGLAPVDLEERRSQGGLVGNGEPVYPRQGREFRTQRVQEGVKVVRAGLGLDENSLGGVPDAAADAVAQGGPVDKRSEADTLDDTLELDPATHAHDA